MNQLQTTGFDYSALDSGTAAIAKLTADKIKRLERLTAQAVLEIGQNLIGMKEVLGHGNFLPWVHAEFQWSEQQARNFMNVAMAFKSTTGCGFQIDLSALYILSAPSTPEPVREEMIERAKCGERITKTIAKEAVKAAKDTVIEYAPVQQQAALAAPAAVAAYANGQTAPEAAPAAPAKTWENDDPTLCGHLVSSFEQMGQILIRRDIAPDQLYAAVIRRNSFTPSALDALEEAVAAIRAASEVLNP